MQIDVKMTAALGVEVEDLLISNKREKAEHQDMEKTISTDHQGTSKTENKDQTLMKSQEISLKDVALIEVEEVHPTEVEKEVDIEVVEISQCAAEVVVIIHLEVETEGEKEVVIEDVENTEVGSEVSQEEVTTTTATRTKTPIENTTMLPNATKREGTSESNQTRVFKDIIEA